MSKKVERRNCKRAFDRINHNAELGESVEEQFQMLKMLIFGMAGNQEVIDVSIHEIKASEDFVDESLECLSSVSQTKRHTGEFKQTKWS